MSIESYTEFIKYNYHDMARELGPEATPQDILEYLLQSWKRLNPREKELYERYRKERLTSGYGGGTGEEDSDEEDNERPRARKTAWQMFVIKNYPIWKSKLPQGARPYAQDFNAWANPIWQNMSPQEKAYYENLTLQR